MSLGLFLYNGHLLSDTMNFISGFSGTSACRIVDIEGNYIKNPAKKYTQVNIGEVKLICRNQTSISQ